VVPCNLLDRRDTAKLPDSENVIYLVGLKFGTSDKPFLTWAMNTLVPANVAERYPRARLAALSTGNVYGLTPVGKGGSKETDVLMPLGEYPSAAIARERIFEFFSHRQGTPLIMLRLNYAMELRYGVFVDIAQKIFLGEPVDVTMGHFNCIWQGDANEFIIRSLAETQSPPSVLNLTGPRQWSVRQVAFEFGKLFGKPVQIAGTEADTALLSNSTRASALWGEPPTPLGIVMRWTADWIKRRGRLLNKPTHFEVRDGKY
jgi:nucleoside-diphosphate-sugar epimerase